VKVTGDMCDGVSAGRNADVVVAPRVFCCGDGYIRESDAWCLDDDDGCGDDFADDEGESDAN